MNSLNKTITGSTLPLKELKIVVCWGLVVIEDLGDWNLLYALTHAPHELPATGSWHRKPGAGRLLIWDPHTV